MKISEWVREQLKTIAHADLDAEVKAGYRFGFSLAGLDKLRTKALPTQDTAKLFDLPFEKVGSTSDGSAHLLASVKELKSELPVGRVWNFSIGTGVGFGFTNSKKEVQPSGKLKEFFGQDSWTVKEPLTQKQIWQAGGSKEGFDKILAKDPKNPEAAFDEFADRWKAFVKTEILDRSKERKKEWAKPTALVFTGGHIEYHGNTLVKKLNAKGLPIPVFAGPKNAGLLGAAWKALEKQNKAK